MGDPQHIGGAGGAQGNAGSDDDALAGILIVGDDADKPAQFVDCLQGVVFADGTVAIRWLTPLRSTSVWPDFDTFDKVHGHPEYESELRWLDA